VAVVLALSPPPPAVAVAVTVNEWLPPGVAEVVMTVRVVLFEVSAPGLPARVTEAGEQLAPAGRPLQVIFAVNVELLLPLLTVTV
jgi:hypothetical protein